MNKTFKICYLCGKEFPVHDSGKYLFKETINGKRAYFCGYNCHRKYRKEKENGRFNQQERGD